MDVGQHPQYGIFDSIVAVDRTRLCEMTQVPHEIQFDRPQARRAEHGYELADGQGPPTTTRSGQPGPRGRTRLEWVCHQSGTDRVYINHKEHYV